VRITFIPTCDCLFVEPGQAQLSSRSEEVFVLTFDPESYDGAIDMDYIVRTTVPGLERALFRVSGQVQPAAGAAAGREGRERLEESSPPALR